MLIIKFLKLGKNPKSNKLSTVNRDVLKRFHKMFILKTYIAPYKGSIAIKTFYCLVCFGGLCCRKRLHEPRHCTIITYRIEQRKKYIIMLVTFKAILRINFNYVNSLPKNALCQIWLNSARWF